MALRVIAPGVATTLQDRGRPGHAAIGVGTSGTVDGELYALCNRLVGNHDGAAALETAGGLVVRVETAAVVAVSSELAPRAAEAGETLSIAPAAGEQWAYLAVRGGFDADSVLGSRSRDTLAALGPPPPRAGDVLRLGPDPGLPIVADLAPRRERAANPRLRVWPGPRLDWLDRDSQERLWRDAWTVSHDVSRVGVRLDGAPLRREHDGELPSEGIVRGAIQVPPDGRPVVMLADHPTTGGYPVVGVVDGGDLAALVQARPGTVVRFRA